MRYIALIHGDDKPGFGISFPDFPGCISDGDTMEDAVRRGREALTFHIESMAEDGEGIPAPTPRAEIETNPEMAAWLEGARWVEVEVDGPPPTIPPAGDPSCVAWGRSSVVAWHVLLSLRSCRTCRQATGMA